MFIFRKYMLAAGILLIGCRAAGQTVYDSIMANVHVVQWNVIHHVPLLDSSVARSAAALRENGSWPDIDYSSHTQTAWDPGRHLERLHEMAIAYTLHGSRYQGNSDIRKKITEALRYWYAADPRSTNWWRQQIFCPKQVGEILILMRAGRSPLPVSLENDLLARMKAIGGEPDGPYSGGGSNRINIAAHWIYRGCLQKDREVLEKGIRNALMPVRFNEPAGGLLPDYSYQEHGRQLYIGNYGYAFVDNISNIALYLRNTSYALSGNMLRLFSNYVRYTYLNVIRGKYYSFSIPGRQVANRDNLDRSGSTDQLYRMQLVDPENITVYDTALCRWSGKCPPSCGVRPLHTHYWMSDYTLHARPGYLFDVRFVSTRTVRTENINSENRKGFFLSEGATNMTARGDEYFNIFPVWDWCRIPGTTAPHLDTLPDMKVSVGGIPGIPAFAGGVSDSLYGVTCYTMDHPLFRTSADKSWFFFDREVVCLGSAVRSSAEQPVNTSINQCLLSLPVTVAENGRVRVIREETAERSLKDAEWVLHDGWGYFFPEGGNIRLSAGLRRGDWHTISVSQQEGTVTKQVFSLWFDHGVKPVDERYAYIIVPGMHGTGDMQAYNKAGDIAVVANTDTVQAVANKRLQMLGIVFYRKEAACASSLAEVWASEPCIVMIRRTGKKQVKVSVADPSQSLHSLSLRLRMAGEENSRRLDLSLPDGVKKGSTIARVIDLDAGTLPVKHNNI